MDHSGYSIRTQQLTKRFGNFTAVDHIDVAVAKGEIFGFLGANGAGKTTAIRMLCGLLSPTSGQGAVAGFDIIRETAKIRTRIGYMSQKFSLYPDLSVVENLRLYGGLYGMAKKDLADRIAEMGHFLGLHDLLPRITGGLPWGWQQRLSLACANLHRPEILFLDEPTGSVDPVSRRNFWDLIHRLSSQGTTIFITSHYMDEVEYCHRLSIMIEGRIAAMGTPRDLKREHGCASIHELFLKLMEPKPPMEADGTGASGGSQAMMSRARLLTIARKEVRHIFRDWQTLVVVVIMPVMMMFLYGYALNADAREIPVLVEMPTPSPETRSVADKIDASGLFAVQGTVPAAADPAELFRLHGIKALFRFPPGFARDVRRPGGARVQVLVDGSDPNLGTIIRNAAEPMLLGATLEVLGVEQPKVLDLRTLILYNPEQRSALFFVPGLMAVILLMISALLTSVAIAREKELGTMGQLLVSPLRPLEIIVGKIIPYLFLAAVDGFLILAVGRLAFGVRIAGNPWFLGVCSLAYIFTALSIGLLISTLARRQQHAMFIAIGATMMPTVLLSGFIFPVASMPLPLQIISRIIPATYFLDIVRGIILKGVGLRELWLPLLVLLGEGVALTGIAIAKFKVKL